LPNRPNRQRFCQRLIDCNIRKSATSRHRRGPGARAARPTLAALVGSCRRLGAQTASGGVPEHRSAGGIHVIQRSAPIGGHLDDPPLARCTDSRRASSVLQHIAQAQPPDLQRRAGLRRGGMGCRSRPQIRAADCGRPRHWRQLRRSCLTHRRSEITTALRVLSGKSRGAVGRSRRDRERGAVLEHADAKVRRNGRSPISSRSIRHLTIAQGCGRQWAVARFAPWLPARSFCVEVLGAQNILPAKRTRWSTSYYPALPLGRSGSVSLHWPGA